MSEPKRQTRWTPKGRLLAVLAKQPVDRPPVICIGGMMNAAIVEIMNLTGHALPPGHFDPAVMADLAADVMVHTGFENIGVPFCMTVEAQALGSTIDPGTLACEPKIAKEAFASVSGVRFGDVKQLARSDRPAVVIDAVQRLSRRLPDVPVVASLTGPISTAASIVDPMTFLKELRKDKANAHRVLEYVTGFLVEYAQALVDAGVSVIAIGDPTATTEILGPAMFEEYAVRYINQLIASAHDRSIPVIVHICGDLNRGRHLLTRIEGDAVSTDALVNLRQLKKDYPQLTTMGNLSTYLLQNGPCDRIAGRTRELLADGIDILSPACGLSTSTSLAHINAMTHAVKAKGAVEVSS
jgi:[methyl-Co(III) methanol-specific corrinoid protein]:coenzyme M methyltransferase